MTKLLNRALNFAVLPFKLDITQVLVDLNRFARSTIWQEFWFGREKENDFEKLIFKQKKTNLPKNHNIPAGLKHFIGSIRSEIMDPRNRNKEECNLPPEELAALKELVSLQRQRIIIIKAADKGAGIVVMNFKDYMKVAYEHLLASQPTQSSESIPNMYYKAVDEFALERAKTQMNNVLKEALENKVITKEEYSAMDASDKDPSKF